jgi:hypothetical protein
MRIRMPPFSDGEEQNMHIDRHFLRKAKTFLIELTAFASLLLVLIKIIVTAAARLFR